MGSAGDWRIYVLVFVSVLFRTVSRGRFSFILLFCGSLRRTQGWSCFAIRATEISFSAKRWHPLFSNLCNALPRFCGSELPGGFKNVTNRFQQINSFSTENSIRIVFYDFRLSLRIIFDGPRAHVRIQSRRDTRSTLVELVYTGCSCDIIWHQNMYPGCSCDIMWPYLMNLLIIN